MDEPSPPDPADGPDPKLLAFDASPQLLVDHGWLPRRSRQRLDSTHVCGLLSTLSRLRCVRETLRPALEELVPIKNEAWLIKQLRATPPEQFTRRWPVPPS